ncbi:MAG: threonine synthase [Nitrospiraceae bacterium]|nr:threonine synthase [Nitrospiraceae bacterium]
MDEPKYDFFCYGCGAASCVRDNTTCPVCGEPFSIRAHATPPAGLFERTPRSMWDYFDLLPVDDRADVVTLNEGATPLIEATRLANNIGAGCVLLKSEMANPTGSFKDRQVSVGISHARAIGADTVAVVSSGNVACAASAYAARCGLKAVLLMHGHAAPGKIAVASVYGGRAIQVDTPSAAEAFDLCIEACRQFGWYHLSTAGMYNPFNVEGAKTIAYELFQQTDGDLPDWIVAPCGGGGLLGGVWRGFLDLKRLGLIDRIPRMAGVQAAGCAPLKKAIDNDTPYLETLEDPWPDPHTIAGGIADDILFDGHTALPAIRTTNGAAVNVDDDEILEGQRLLATQEGLLCEPTTAVVIAALRHLPGIASNTRICCIVTGTGSKDLDTVKKIAPPAVHIEPTLEALNTAFHHHDDT